MLKSIIILFACLLLGNAINHVTGLPLPGAVIGLLLLLAILIWRRGPDQPLKQTSDFLLQNMMVLFLPASLGLMTQFPVLRQNAVAIGIAIIASTLIGMAVTAVIMQILARHPRPSEEQE
jgi:putative effector of murein hydrolase LrgA (UPF0299 family)